jgi:hypothetical protein
MTDSRSDHPAHAHRRAETYARHEADAAFASAFAAGYRGRHAPADAAWWLSHPDEHAPSGLPSPTTERAVAARATYTRAGSADDALLVALRRLDDLLDADRVDALAALRHAERAVGADAGGVDHSDGPAVEPASDIDEPHGEPAGRRSPWPRRAALVAVASALVTAGFVCGAWATARPGEDVGGSALDGDASRLGKVPEPGLRALFDRPPVPADMPAVALAPDFAADSFRRVDQFGGSAGDGMAIVYAARESTGRLCLVVVHGPEATSQCIDDSPTDTSEYAMTWGSGPTWGSVTWSRAGLISLSGSVSAG